MNAVVLRPATLWQRIKAFALDYLLIAAYLLVVVAVGAGLYTAAPAISQRLFANRARGQLISFVLVTLPVTLYFALMEASPRQATWGKQKIGLRVLRSGQSNEGAPLSFARALWRTVLKFTPWELSHTLIWQLRFSSPEAEPLISAGFWVVWLLIAANVVSLWLNKQHQTLYDWLSGSIVVA